MKKRSIVVASVVVIVCLNSVVSGQKAELEKEKCPEWTPHVKPEDVKALPEITSLIQGVEIARASFADMGTPRAALILNVKNATNLPVVMISFFTRSFSGRDTGGYRVDPAPDPSKQRAVIAAGETKEFRWSTNHFLDLQFPIMINAVQFFDRHIGLLEVGDVATHQDVRRDREKLQKENETKASKVNANPNP